MRNKCRYIIQWKGDSVPTFSYNVIYYYEVISGVYLNNYLIYEDIDSIRDIGSFNKVYFEVMFSTLEFERKRKLEHLNNINVR